MRCGHLTYDPWIWLKVTSLSSTASKRKGVNFFFAKKSLNVPYVKMFSIFQCFWLIYAFLGKMTACTFHTYWVISLASWTSAASMTSVASMTSTASMTWTASFHQKTYWAWCCHQPGNKMTNPDLSMWNGSSKIHNFMDFWHSFCWRLWRPWMLLSTKSNGHKSNVRIS